MNPFEWHWLAKTFLSLACVIPAWLSINFFERSYHIKGEVTLTWYFLFAALGNAFLIKTMNPATAVVPPLIPLVLIALVGITLGAGANGFLFSAIPEAPNQAIPQAIQGTSAAFVFLLAILLGRYAPKFFPIAETDPYKFVGVVGVLISGVLIIFGRNILTVLSLR